MKISNGNVEITEIPYFDKITVTRNSIGLDREGPISYTWHEITDLRDALTAAVSAHAVILGFDYRWTRLRATSGQEQTLHADILGADIDITADPDAGAVTALIPEQPMDPDTARMVGVRLIEAAALADNGRSVREP